jgi:hypothetical protein
MTPYPDWHRGSVSGVRSLALAMLAVAGLSACGAAGSTAAPTTSTAAAADDSGTTVSSSADDGQIMCEVKSASNGGSYWLLLTSATSHDWTACAGAHLQPANLDTIMSSGAGVDRRCIGYPGVGENALVGVYSSTSSADLADADDLCQSQGWTND